ncbi:ubiquitin-like protein [Rhizoclosmatium globosum]|uniref:Ubiquitin-like protein n=1 Tax=Rhizoclosmatium globosum TaxID=329046 RepID=A0A1Y2CSE1_9FUNG|nr:ubiquitin-like protein [Rhizoclosmatium globosum]|eukprot:ORY49980.1 ubiquitin-like protein [Rhizoclosmatium globosum]
MTNDVKEENAKVEQITIRVKGGDGAEIEFKIKNTTTMGKVQAAYAQKLGINKDTVRFKFDGAAVTMTQTPADLGLEDGDSIDAFVQQIGGCC